MSQYLLLKRLKTNAYPPCQFVFKTNSILFTVHQFTFFLACSPLQYLKKRQHGQTYPLRAHSYLQFIPAKTAAGLVLCGTEFAYPLFLNPSTFFLLLNSLLYSSQIFNHNISRLNYKSVSDNLNFIIYLSLSSSPITFSHTPYISISGNKDGRTACGSYLGAGQGGCSHPFLVPPTAAQN